MADRCVPRLHCGTLYPGWLSGAHPTAAQGVVTRRVCFSSSSNCCNWFNNIRLKNCGAYFVYELPRTPICPARYCSNGSAGKFLCMFLLF